MAQDTGLGPGTCPGLAAMVTQAFLWDKLPIAEIVNVKVVTLDQAPEGYKNVDAGTASKFVLEDAASADLNRCDYSAASTACSDPRAFERPAP
jgi:hypothetical protein